jgi:hypothetical protein
LSPTLVSVFTGSASSAVRFTARIDAERAYSAVLEKKLDGAL